MIWCVIIVLAINNQEIPCDMIMLMAVIWGFRSKEQSRGIHATGMEAASSTVPSIVVYVTVPNKEAGFLQCPLLLLLSPRFLTQTALVSFDLIA